MTETESNIAKYMALVKSLDPDLHMIKIALQETRVNPDVIPAIIRNIGNIAHGTGFGNVKISISDRIIEQISAVESELVKEPALLLE